MIGDNKVIEKENKYYKNKRKYSPKQKIFIIIARCKVKRTKIDFNKILKEMKNKPSQSTNDMPADNNRKNPNDKGEES